MNYLICTISLLSASALLNCEAHIYRVPGLVILGCNALVLSIFVALAIIERRITESYEQGSSDRIAKLIRDANGETMRRIRCEMHQPKDLRG